MADDFVAHVLAKTMQLRGRDENSLEALARLADGVEIARAPVGAPGIPQGFWDQLIGAALRPSDAPLRVRARFRDGDPIERVGCTAEQAALMVLAAVAERVLKLERGLSDNAPLTELAKHIQETER